MYKYDQVINALDRFCEENGESLEQREQRLDAKSAPIRQALIDPSGFVINRNIKLVLLELNIDLEEFHPYLNQGRRWLRWIGSRN